MCHVYLYQECSLFQFGIESSPCMYEAGTYQYQHSPGTCIQESCLDCLDPWKGGLAAAGDQGGLAAGSLEIDTRSGVTAANWAQEDSMLIFRESVSLY